MSNSLNLFLTLLMINLGLGFSYDDNDSFFSMKGHGMCIYRCVKSKTSSNKSLPICLISTFRLVVFITVLVLLIVILTRYMKLRRFLQKAEKAKKQ
ncbi:hypothetical protein TUBRATIS_005830 [Tubulinosema ratisbonensis]|uniref:Uncharacterized protein n=1 Tax=Tubulinosema ratisbonensis TaxID=291195 RepID=A0A437AP89_9MICR|nr:hypothetical protein TUBRATIS_005830 [Tubulinosema ratisbonensis]